MKRIGASVFQELGRGRMDDRTMFSRLTTFHLPRPSHHSFLYSITFIQRNISTLDVPLPDDPQTREGYLKEIVSRAPNVQNLTLQFSTSVKPFEATLIGALTHLTQLRNLELPEYSLTSNIVSTLSSFPNLRTLSMINEWQTTSHGVLEDVKHWSPVLKPGAFPSLNELSIAASFPDFSRFLKHGSGPRSLTSLDIQPTRLERTTSTRVLSLAISETCANLTQLILDISVERASEIIPDMKSGNFIYFDDVKPVLGIRSMTSFTIRHHHRLILRDENILEIIQAWPAIEELSLNAHPISNVLGPPGSTPSCLTYFRGCTALRSLAIYIDFSGEISAQPHGALTGLKSLDLGTSPLDLYNSSRIHGAAIFLSSLLTPTCLFQASRDAVDVLSTFIPEVLGDLPGHTDRLNENWEAWEKVEEILPVVFRAKELGRMEIRSQLSESTEKKGSVS